MRTSASTEPLAGVTVVELAGGVAAAYAGRLLATLGAETILVEPAEGHRLRREPPFLPPGNSASAVFGYFAAGKQSVVCDPPDVESLAPLLGRADIFLTDLPPADRTRLGLDDDNLRQRHPALIAVSSRPFGAQGPKADWSGEEINIVHAAGEGYLMPNGLSAELFPQRPPLKIHGHFAECQGGVAAALGALCALSCRDRAGAESIDISVQDAMLAVGAFAIQRYGDGCLEHRLTRSFKYGGVLRCADGYVELLTLEERQWQALVTLMGQPEWALDPSLADPLERARRGPEINAAIRAWAKHEATGPLVARAQVLGVPMAKFASPAEVLANPHEAERGLFQQVPVPGACTLPMLVAPFHIDGVPLRLRSGPPELNAHRHLLAAAAHRAGAAAVAGAS